MDVLDVWSDHRIVAGEDLNAHIDAALESADVIALLVSSDFMASDYCYGIEMKRAMERHAAGEATVLPVMLRPCDVKGAPFAKLKMVPTDARAVTKWANQDEAFLDVVQTSAPLAGIPAVLDGRRRRARGLHRKGFSAAALQ